MAMPMRRFLAYVKQIPAVRAEETLAAIEAATVPQLEKRRQRQALRRLRRIASGAAPAKAKKTGIPTDVAGLMALGMPGLVQIVKKETKADE